MVPWIVPVLCAHMRAEIHRKKVSKRNDGLMKWLRVLLSNKTNESEIKPSTESGNNRGRPNDVSPGRLEGAGDGINERFRDHGVFGYGSGNGGRHGRRAVSDKAKGAIPSVFMQMDGEDCPTREQKDRQQGCEPRGWRGKGWR